MDTLKPTEGGNPGGREPYPGVEEYGCETEVGTEAPERAHILLALWVGRRGEGLLEVAERERR